MGKKSFLRGAAVLALAGVVVRIIGALYRIPLVRIIGVDGVALYQMAYPVYGLLLTLSTAGVPGAISKMVSERLVHGDRRGARRIFTTSLIILSAVGLASAVVMALASGQIAGYIAGQSGPLAQPSMFAAAPALFFVAVITAFRGYFQGLQDMTPTAVSQVWEQIIKIVPGFFIAARLNQYGVQYGAAGAMWGVVLSEVVALGYLFIVYVRKRRVGTAAGARTDVPEKALPSESFGSIAGRLVSLALPMMAGAVFLPLASLADAFIVMNRLADLGYDQTAARAMYGILSGMVNVLVNVPSVLSLSLSTSLIPAIAESVERRDGAAVERKSRVGLKTTMLLALPSATGLAVLAKPVLSLLYGPSLTPAQLAIGAGLLASTSVSVVFLSIVQSTNGTLQGLGRVYVPMVSLAVGALVKIALNYVLIGIPAINIHGAPLGTIVCYLIPAAINLAFVARSTGMKLRRVGMLLRPGLASLCMGGLAWAITNWLPSADWGKLATVAAVLLCMPAYLILLVLFGAVGRDELSYLPRGSKLIGYLEKRKLLRS